MRKKFFRGVGYFFCAVLIILCIILIIATAAFGSRKTVDAFGYNIYIVNRDGFDTAPLGSAVLVRKCGALELEQGNLVLWNDNDEQPVLGYVREITLSDGVYSLKLDENGEERIVAESQIIGHAQFSSTFLGHAVLFIKSPIGMFCIAVLPCIALILFDIIRAGAQNKPEPEVEPQYKNVLERASAEQQRKVQNNTIGVNSDGKAAYGHRKVPDTAAADQVLFELAAHQKKAETSPIPVRKNNPGTIAAESSTQIAKPVNSKPITESKEYPRFPSPVAMKAYSKVAENSKKSVLSTASVKDKTAEIPNISKQDSGNAFFAQTSTVTTGAQIRSAPQIGKTADRSEKPGESLKNTASRLSSRRKSSQILASKSIDDLISDDDDYRDKSRISNNLVDDILADISRNDNK